MKTIKFLLLAALMLTYTISTYGQDKSHYMPKFAIKTNALYWATTTANLGFEVGLSKKLTLDVSGKKYGSVSASIFLDFFSFEEEIIYMAFVILSVSLILFIRSCISFVFAIILPVTLYTLLLHP